VCAGYCGNDVVDGDEECDGTENCGDDCSCLAGFGSVQTGACVPAYTCSGFHDPFEVPLRLKEKVNRTIPLKMELYHFETPITDTDVSAPPVVNITYDPDAWCEMDASDHLEPPGLADEGNAFRWINGTWIHNLGTRPWSSSGTYEVTVAPGDTSYVIVEPACVGIFVRQQ
jgi:hypothetical protein